MLSTFFLKKKKINILIEKTAVKKIFDNSEITEKLRKNNKNKLSLLYYYVLLLIIILVHSIKRVDRRNSNN